jgi:CheY-like chemotaxis protein
MAKITSQDKPARQDIIFSEIKVLIIDDDEVTIDVIRRYLKNSFELHAATNKHSAIESAQKSKYDIILLDINLGKETNGLDVLRELREIEGYEKTPVVAFTAYAMRGDREKFIAGGCDYYISKPFERQELLNLLGSIVKRENTKN